MAFRTFLRRIGVWLPHAASGRPHHRHHHHAPGEWPLVYTPPHLKHAAERPADADDEPHPGEPSLDDDTSAPQIPRRGHRS